MINYIKKLLLIYLTLCFCILYPQSKKHNKQATKNLIEAVKEDNIEKAILALKNNGKINVHFKSKKNLLYKSVEKKHINMTAFLLNPQKYDPSCPKKSINPNAQAPCFENDYTTPLTIAIKNNDRDIAKLLLDANANPNRATEINYRTLIIAYKNNNKAAVNLLLENKANPLFLALWIKENSSYHINIKEEAIKLLYKHANVAQKLYMAAIFNDFAYVKKIIEKESCPEIINLTSLNIKKTDIYENSDISSDIPNTLSHFLLKTFTNNDNLDAVLWLLKRYNLTSHVIVHRALEKKAKKITSYILEQNHPIFSLDENGKSIFEIILEHETEGPDPYTKNVRKKLLKNMAPDEMLTTSLLDNNEKGIQNAFEKKAGLYSQNNVKLTPLYYAIKHCNGKNIQNFIKLLKKTAIKNKAYLPNKVKNILTKKLSKEIKKFIPNQLTYLEACILLKNEQALATWLAYSNEIPIDSKISEKEDEELYSLYTITQEAKQNNYKPLADFCIKNYCVFALKKLLKDKKICLNDAQQKKLAQWFPEDFDVLVENYYLSEKILSENSTAKSYDTASTEIREILNKAKIDPETTNIEKNNQKITTENLKQYLEILNNKTKNIAQLNTIKNNLLKYSPKELFMKRNNKKISSDQKYFSDNIKKAYENAHKDNYMADVEIIFSE